MGGSPATRRPARGGWPLAVGTRPQTKNNPATNQPAGIAELRRPFSQHAAPSRARVERPCARRLRTEKNGDILANQARQGWGAKVIDRLAADLQRDFPKLSGYSVRNLKYMRAFAESWPDRPIVHQLAAQIPWGHNCVLLDRVRDAHARAFYIRHTIQHGWARSVLVHQIDTQLHKRQGLAPTNFARALPAPESDLAREMLKDPYILQPAALDESANERALENALLARLKDFLIELGSGFAFVGNQVPLEVDREEFFLDLLFYHTRLHCYIVIDLKVVDFQPEFAGKMNPVRYQSYEPVPLRLCPAKSQRQQPLCWRNTRPAFANPATRRRRCAIHGVPSSVGTCLLRSVPLTTRCIQAREVFEKRMGQTLPQDAARRLSHEVNFYQTAVDNVFKSDKDVPTIGLILCRGKNKTIVEYTLRDVKSPMGVAEYRLLPPKLPPVSQLKDAVASLDVPKS